ncbi:MAG: hypothetical protein WBD31_13640 [Rubripirellula sp.]
MNHQPSQRRQTSPYLRIEECISTSGCDGSEVKTDTKWRMSFNDFDAEIIEAVYDPDGDDDEHYLKTGETIKVRHKFRDPMDAGEVLTVVLMPDNRWVALTWECGG